jgi:prolyl-tRNA editing enzyme YbaK/EbsC (Cys-tRNA(Pro) deacylase)
MHPRAEEFVDRARERYGFEPAVQEFPEGTHTAADAADAIGCPVGAVASSLVVTLDGTGADDPSGDRDPAVAEGPDAGVVVAVTSGANRVATDRVATHVGATEARLADAETVREATGWAIGGVPPFAHDRPLPVLFDPSLDAFGTVWAAAGTPEAVFPVAPGRLVRLSNGRRVDVTRSAD